MTNVARTERKSADSLVKATPADSSPLRLWVNHEWYIPVDAKGRCIGPCNEGALGFVVQLQSERRSQYRMALKLPRLMGETRRENAYISELMEKELMAVESVFRGSGDTRGLLYADVAAGSPMRGPISTARGIPEAQAWNNALIFVHYKKGQNPYFCLAKVEDDQMKCFPPGSICPISDVNMVEYIKEKANDHFSFRDWAKTVFLDFETDRETEELSQTEESIAHTPIIFTVDDTLRESAVNVLWSTCLPSVLYRWAAGTLQEMISLHKCGHWTISQHLQLIYNVCSGLRALHSRGMLHADVRPANIIYQEDPTDPNKYYLSDYGSFAETGARSAERYPAEPTGRTVGPIVGGERTSAFYAPERRAGHEREEADTAVIVSPGDGSFRYVILGWRSDLIDSETGQPKPELLKYQDQSELQKLEGIATQSLIKGDRIQIREYIFDIIEEWSLEDKQILQCSHGFWKVYHGRIVVGCSDPLSELDWFPIPRTIELLQWSASTDLYSLGVLALYSVYRSAFPSANSEHSVLTETSYSQESSAKSSSQAEKGFNQMLTYLADTSYFNAIWLELEWMRNQLEENLPDDRTAIAYANGLFKPHPLINPEQTGDQIDEDQPRTLKTESIAIVSRITQTVPGTEHLVRVFDNNLGAFIFFMHFVLRCLHREEDMKPKVNEELGWLTKPFCQKRSDPPTPEGAVTQALRRLEKIQEMMSNPRLSGLKSEKEKIPSFDPRPEPMIRAQLNQLEEDKQVMVQENQELLSQLGDITQQLKKALELTEKTTGLNPFKSRELLKDIRATLEEAYRLQAEPNSAEQA